LAAPGGNCFFDSLISPSRVFFFLTLPNVFRSHNFSIKPPGRDYGLTHSCLLAPFCCCVPVRFVALTTGCFMFRFCARPLESPSPPTSSLGSPNTDGDLTKSGVSFPSLVSRVVWFFGWCLCLGCVFVVFKQFTTCSFLTLTRFGLLLFFSLSLLGDDLLFPEVYN